MIADASRMEFDKDENGDSTKEVERRELKTKEDILNYVSGIR